MAVDAVTATVGCTSAAGAELAVLSGIAAGVTGRRATAASTIPTAGAAASGVRAFGGIDGTKEKTLRFYDQITKVECRQLHKCSKHTHIHACVQTYIHACLHTYIHTHTII